MSEFDENYLTFELHIQNFWVKIEWIKIKWVYSAKIIKNKFISKICNKVNIKNKQNIFECKLCEFENLNFYIIWGVFQAVC